MPSVAHLLQPLVSRRTGGLESLKWLSLRPLQVSRRTGGLEKLM